MKRLATATLSLLLSAAALYSSTAPAAACSCSIPTEVEEVRRSMEYFDIVIEGTIAPREGDLRTDHMRFEPQVVYSGDAPGEITLDQTWEIALSHSGPSYLTGGCSYLLTGRPGDRHLLYLEELSSGRYSPAGCSSFSVDNMEREVEPYNWLQQHYDAIKLISDGGTVVGEAPPQAEPADHTEDTPWAIILPLAFAIPLAVLFVPAFLRRRGGH